MPRSSAAYRALGAGKRCTDHFKGSDSGLDQTDTFVGNPVGGAGFDVRQRGAPARRLDESAGWGPQSRPSNGEPSPQSGTEWARLPAGRRDPRGRFAREVAPAGRLCHEVTRKRDDWREVGRRRLP
ncbi:hypothetical protein OB955_14555 [Halobacteria archaeon AArc-m2/3/4]|uniref:Uncharacterized protein n=1 Tax=Natronoglomus mannanivorans TaxID=2979990 RepID=A0ABT2QGA3_9EURY|nr:hypothetical protein [Halobacteria archaeon AArc-m2/3/4]